MLVWQFEVIPMAGLLYFALVYALAVGPLRLRFFPDRRFPMGRVILFALGMLVFFLALASPLHTAAEVYLVSAHMLQLMLVVVVPPLLLAGTPGYLLDAVIKLGPVYPVARLLTRPVSAFVIFQVTFVLWHIPPVFRVILFDEVLHGLGYIAILAASVVMWWPVLNPSSLLSPAPYATRFFYLLALSVAHMPLMGVIGLAQEPIYPWYALAPRLFGLSPMADQQIGTVIMGVMMLMALLIPTCVVGLRWLDADTPRPADKAEVAG